MDELGVPADEACYTHVMDVCCRNGQWKVMVDMLEAMNSRGAVPTQHAVATLMSALAKSGR
jgi:pentatricopeptide repeat protein